MTKLKIVSAKRLIKLMEKRGFVRLRQAGSHLLMEKEDLTTVIPIHARDFRGA
ncbi:type II toxin-antitoxin system HicA family toxin [Candidatus Peregrinibacteria bacterium]|nr:MAG: type II toxin-antitoxin system HicA family toxin [Candidatus Peregrinibacteria bacterium]